jgi:hypothetical protein
MHKRIFYLLLFIQIFLLTSCSDILGYFLSNDVIRELVKLTASDAEDFDYFCCSVSIYGNYALVGAGGKEEGGLNRGAAYIFTLP